VKVPVQAERLWDGGSEGAYYSITTFIGFEERPAIGRSVGKMVVYSTKEDKERKESKTQSDGRRDYFDRRLGQGSHLPRPFEVSKTPFLFKIQDVLRYVVGRLVGR
jgi:hypothetical protein